MTWLLNVNKIDYFSAVCFVSIIASLPQLNGDPFSILDSVLNHSLILHVIFDIDFLLEWQEYRISHRRMRSMIYEHGRAVWLEVTLVHQQKILQNFQFNLRFLHENDYDSTITIDIFSCFFKHLISDNKLLCMIHNYEASEEAVSTYFTCLNRVNKKTKKASLPVWSREDQLKWGWRRLRRMKIRSCRDESLDKKEIEF